MCFIGWVGFIEDIKIKYIINLIYFLFPPRFYHRADVPFIKKTFTNK